VGASEEKQTIQGPRTGGISGKPLVSGYVLLALKKLGRPCTTSEICDLLCAGKAALFSEGTLSLHWLLTWKGVLLSTGFPPSFYMDGVILSSPQGLV